MNKSLRTDKNSFSGSLKGSYKGSFKGSFIGDCAAASGMAVLSVRGFGRSIGSNPLLQGVSSAWEVYGVGDWCLGFVGLGSEYNTAYLYFRNSYS